MKILKQIIRWFKNLFLTKDQVSEVDLKEMKDLVEKMETSRTNKQKRDWWLKSKGYSNTFSKEQKNQQSIRRQLKAERTPQLSSYMSQVNNIINLKRQGLVNIYTAQRNRQSIPYFEVKKTTGEQLGRILSS